MGSVNVIAAAVLLRVSVRLALKKTGALRDGATLFACTVPRVDALTKLSDYDRVVVQDLQLGDLQPVPHLLRPTGEKPALAARARVGRAAALG